MCVTDLKHTDLPLVCETRVVFLDHTASTDTWGHRFHPDSYSGPACDILKTKTRHKKRFKQHLLCKQAISHSLVCVVQYVYSMWSTSLHLVSGLLVIHVIWYGIRCDSSGERLPQQHSKTPHITLSGVSPWWNNRGQRWDMKPSIVMDTMCFGYRLIPLNLT